MKRFPITAEERRFVLSLEKSAALFFLMFKIYPHPVNSDSLAFEFKWDKRKAKGMLDDLSSDGFTALLKGQGYVLTSQSRKMFVDFFVDVMMLDLQAQALAPESKAQALKDLEVTTSASMVDEEFVTKLDSTHSARALKEEVEELNLIKEIKDSSPSSEENTQNVRSEKLEPEFAPGVTTRKILEVSHILFGEPGVFLNGLKLDTILPHYAMGWVAQAYDQRRRDGYPRGLAEPAGLVYQRLRDSELPKPRESYYTNPLAYLPDEYLEALGLAEYVCEDCKETFNSRSKLDEHRKLLFRCENQSCEKRFHTLESMEKHMGTDHLVTKTQAEGEFYELLDADNSGARAWQLVKDELQAELPKASFETWVRDTKAVQFEKHTLTVLTRNAYAMDWLNSRLTNNINVMLKNFMQENVKVKFVVGRLAEEDGEA